MKMYETIFNDGYENVAVGQRAYHRRAFNAVVEGFLMQVFNEMYEGRIIWYNEAPLMGSQENLQIATGFLPGAQKCIQYHDSHDPRLYRPGYCCKGWSRFRTESPRVGMDLVSGRPD